MNRLTYKLDEPIKTLYLNYEYKRIKDYDIDRGNFGRISDDMIFNKLGKLEDIEDELGCPLEVVFKALKNGQVIYKHIVGLENPKTYLATHKISGLVYNGKNYGLWLYDRGFGDEFYVYTKDYKNTWWLKEDLTKEELENE